MDGKVQFLSASSIQKADASTGTGCLRAWVYQYRYGIKEPPSKAMERGIKLHAELEGFLKTGRRDHLSSLALHGLHMLPDVGDPAVRAALLVEHSIVPADPTTGDESLALAPLRLAGVPLLGKIDLLHNLGLNYGADEMMETRDPEGTVEVGDHKTTGDIKNAKQKHELPELVQMASYAEYVWTVAPDTKFVRLSHNYFPERGQPRKVSLRVVRDQVQGAWNHAGAVARAVKDAAAEPDVDRVEANLNACHAYHRTCPAFEQCKAAQHNSLAGISSVFGRTAADRVLGAVAGIPEAGTAVTAFPGTMSTEAPFLLAQLQAQSQHGAPAPAAVPAVFALPVQPPAPVAAPPPTVIAATVQSEMQRIEAALAAGAAASQQPDISAMLAAVEAHGCGRPALHGDIAVKIALAGGQSIAPGTSLAGLGLLGQFNASTEPELRAILMNLDAIAKEKSVSRAADVSPAVPAATPAPVVAEAPVATPAAAEAPKKTRKKRDAAVTVVVAPVAAPVTADIAPLVEQPSAVILGVIPVQVVPPAPVAAPAPTVINIANVAPLAVANTNTAVNVYVDCVVDGIHAESLWPLVHEYEDILNKEAGAAANPPVPALPFKASEKLAYGKGEQLLGAMIREAYARGRLKPGNYVLDGVGSSLGQAAVEALRDVVHKSRGVFVRGVRS